MDYNASTKIGDKWKTVFSVKTTEKGKQISFSPLAKELFKQWLDDPATIWLNFPLFQNESQAVKPAESKVLEGLDDNDSVPF